MCVGEVVLSVKRRRRVDGEEEGDACTRDTAENVRVCDDGDATGDASMDLRALSIIVHSSSSLSLSLCTRSIVVTRVSSAV